MEVLKFSLCCTCRLQVDVVKDVSATLLEDNVVQVRNKSLGAVDQDWEWFLSSLFLPHHWWWALAKTTAIIKFCFLAWAAAETNLIFENNRDVCGYRSYLNGISPREKCFKDTSPGPGDFFKLQRQWQALSPAKCTHLVWPGRFHVTSCYSSLLWSSWKLRENSWHDTDQLVQFKLRGTFLQWGSFCKVMWSLSSCSSPGLKKKKHINCC